MTFYLKLTLLLLLQPVVFMNNYEDWYSSEIRTSINNHNSWEALLQKYVDQEGNVDYQGFRKDETALDQYLDNLAQNAPTNKASKEEQLVYYINLYNAATVKLILENYPVQSIKDIKNPWDRKWIRVGENSLSLGGIEHKILRKLDEPRIHFAINCASYSCPKLSNHAYTLENLESELNKASRDFINDSKRNRISKESAQISQIFKWYKADFTTNGTLLDYINRYTTIPISANAKIQYIKYDWSLNEIK